MKLKYFFPFLLSNLLLQLNAQSPTQPLCEGTLCQDICFDLEVTASDLPAEVCTINTTLIDFQLDITGIGADVGYYNIFIFNNTNPYTSGFYTHNPGDPTIFLIPTTVFVVGCEPEDQTFSYEIRCPDDGTILASGTVGTARIYPPSYLFSPVITPSIACTQDLVIVPRCGILVLDPDPIPITGCGGEDTQVNWSVAPGFVSPCGLSDEGTETIFACGGTSGDPCDDNNPCTTNGTLNENCICQGEGPTAILNTPLPAATCRGVTTTLSITLDLIPSPNGVLVRIVDQLDFSWGSVQISPGDPFTVDLDIFRYTTLACDFFDYELFLELRCPVSPGNPANNPLIGNSVSLGTVTLFPNIGNFTVEIEPAIECGVAPVIIAPTCGDLVLNEMPADPPSCPAGADGFVDWTVDPGFDIGAAPGCFDGSLLNGQEPITACNNCIGNCEDGTLCQDVCFDLTAAASDLPAEVCSSNFVTFQYQLEVTGIGADVGNYNILTIDNNGNTIGFDIHNAGDPTTLFPTVFMLADRCDPKNLTLFYEIQCPDDGTILASGTVGTVAIYPPTYFFSPIITPSIACVQDLMIVSNCGTVVLDPDPIPIAGCGGEDTQVNWSIDFGFEYPPECITSAIEGTETVFACDGMPGDLCDDNNPCTTNDTLNENCICTAEGPTAILNTTLPAAVCLGVPTTLSITLDIIPSPDGVIVQIDDQNSNVWGSVQIFPGDPLTFDFDVVTSISYPCDVSDFELFLELKCPVNNGLFGNSMPLGTVTLFPNSNNFMVEIEPAVECGVASIIIAPYCGNLVLTETPADPTDCPAGSDGFVDWIVDPGFDISDAPPCFDVSLLTGQELIPACDNCEPQDCMIMPDIAVNIVCNDNGTPDNAGDDTYTFDITVNGNNTASGATNTFNDDQGNIGIAYGSTVSYGPFPIAAGNVVVNFTDTNDANCTGMMMATAPATCSGEVICEDEISGTVFAPAGCDVSNIEVTIYDGMGNIIVILATDMNGIYDSTPTAYPCGSYSVELTNNLPQCYFDELGETGPKTFVIDGDDNNTDTDGQDFMPTAIPTLSQWGLIILSLLMMCFGAIRIAISNNIALKNEYIFFEIDNQKPNIDC